MGKIEVGDLLKGPYDAVWMKTTDEVFPYVFLSSGSYKPEQRGLQQAIVPFGVHKVKTVDVHVTTRTHICNIKLGDILELKKMGCIAMVLRAPIRTDMSWKFVVLKPTSGNYKRGQVVWLFSPEFGDAIKSPFTVCLPDDDYIDWSHVNRKFRYMARNKNGRVWLHEDKPEYLTDGDWLSDGYIVVAETLASLRVGNKHYRESLVERPKGV